MPQFVFMNSNVRSASFASYKNSLSASLNKIENIEFALTLSGVE